MITKQIKECLAWSLIVDTTPDLTHTEQLSICLRIVATDGKITEHLLGCNKAEITTGKSLFEIFVKAFESKGVSLEKLKAQTNVGASNMSGRCNGLQAIIKEKIGKHVLYVHCYAHLLNLVMSDSVGAGMNVGILFDSLEALHNLFNRCHKVHEYFEKAQKNEGIQVLTVKRLNTVRWSSREICLDTFNKRYDVIMKVLKDVSEDSAIDEKHQSIANGLFDNFSCKEFVATALLFIEIFGITGPLSRCLQSKRVDLAKACSLVTGSKKQIESLRHNCETIIEKMNSFENCRWNSEGSLRRRIKRLNVNESDEDVWRR